MIAENIPQAMKSEMTWCLAGPQDDPSLDYKIPYYFKAGMTSPSRAMSSHPEEYGQDFDTVYAQWAHMVKYDPKWGMGLLLKPDIRTLDNGDIVNIGLTCIDLDNKKQDPELFDHYIAICTRLNSYTELSANGGLHCWVQGYMPALRGYHPILHANVEIYSEERFMRCTGNMLNINPNIENRQEHLDYFDANRPNRNKMVDDAVMFQAKRELFPMEVIQQRAWANPKFQAVFNLDLNSAEVRRAIVANKPSHEITLDDIDFSVIDGILAGMLLDPYVGASFAQVQACLKASRIGQLRVQYNKQPQKYDRLDYIERTMRGALQYWPESSHPVRAFDGNKHYMWDGSIIDESIGSSSVARLVAKLTGDKVAVAESQIAALGLTVDEAKDIVEIERMEMFPTLHRKTMDDYLEESGICADDIPLKWQLAPIDLPVGKAGVLCEWLHKQARTSIPEFSIASTLGIIAGLVNVAYSREGRFPSLYMIIGAPSGVGKDEIINNVIAVSRMLSDPTCIPALKDTDKTFFIQERMASPQAIMKVLGRNHGVLQVSREIGSTIAKLAKSKTGFKTDSNSEDYLSYLNDITSGGPNKGTPGQINAKDENSHNLDFDSSLSIIGTCVPEEIRTFMTSGLASTGFVSRLICIVSMEGGSVPNSDISRSVHLDMSAFKSLRDLAERQIEVKAQSRQPQEIKGHPHILKVFTAYCRKNLEKIAVTDELKRQEWVRLPENSTRIASLLAVFENPDNPVITESMARWSINYIMYNQTRLRKMLKDEGSSETGEAHTALLEKLLKLANQNGPKLQRGKLRQILLRTKIFETRADQVIASLIADEYVTGLDAVNKSWLIINVNTISDAIKFRSAA